MTILLIIGITLHVGGGVLIAYTALRVHDRVRKEHSIDLRVTKEMRRERIIGITGAVSMIIGYVFQVAGLLL